MSCRRLLFIALFCAHFSAWAHKASDSYLVIDARGSEVIAQWDIALRDIDFAIGLDGDGNGEITWGELRTRQANVAAWALSRLEVQRGGPCPLKLTALQVDTHTDGGYAVLHLAGACPASAGDLQLGYRLLFDLDGLHRGLLRLTVDGTTHSAVLSPTSGTLRFGPDAVSRLTQFRQYLVEGIWHIWIGFDHILFLLALLLPAVLVHTKEGWRGVARFGAAWREVLWVVTSFTAAHSITLSLAALGVLALPSRLVESAIALSVVLAAANNLYPVVAHRRWVVAFGFGLIHGFGFASVLSELGLPADSLVLSLVGFNLGVEVGQLAIVAGFLPLAFVLRHSAFYRRGVFVWGSLFTVLVAALWLIERAFDLKLLSR
ncbi:HupE/UreJ family protein [Dechloromonas sp. A34]|uniref:HupE/UreJ family protein n=1 Tax=Dechloromonas sp. A34 TaxID=447588 RepID=UPI0022494FBB|nr:HupE/UreJ family protein [Dechloromonas sp. A34]